MLYHPPETHPRITKEEKQVQEKHFDPQNTLVAIWIPFVAADLGNFAGGGWSSWLISIIPVIALVKDTVLPSGRNRGWG